MLKNKMYTVGQTQQTWGFNIHLLNKWKNTNDFTEKAQEDGT